MVKARPDLPLCPECFEPMKLVRTIPPLGGLLELFAFYCEPCGVAETREQENDAEADE